MVVVRCLVGVFLKMAGAKEPAQPGRRGASLRDRGRCVKALSRRSRSALLAP